MEQKRLRLYKLDMKYIRDLAKKDDSCNSHGEHDFITCP